MVVADSSEYRDFTEVVRQRDTQLEKRGASSAWAAGLAGLDLLGAALGWETAKCIIGAEVTLGTSCIGFLVLVGGGLMAAGKEVADYLAADRELTRQGGLKEQATDKLADLRGQP